MTLTIYDSRGAAYPGKGPRVLKERPLTKKERQIKSAAQPKCPCGSCLSLERTAHKIKWCPACAPNPVVDVPCSKCTWDMPVTLDELRRNRSHTCSSCEQEALREATNGAQEWQPMDTCPKGEIVLVLMPPDGSVRPRIHGALFREEIGIIGHTFAHDLRPPIGWMYPPAIPDGL